MLRTALALGLVNSLALGCAVRSGRGVGYAELQSQRCGHLPDDRAEVRATVRDEKGQPVAGIHVYLLPADDRHGTEPVIARTGADGVATLIGHGGFYALAVVFVGFEPQSRLMRLAEGCSGSADFVLHVLRVEGLSVATEPSNNQMQRTKPAQTIALRR